MEHGLALVDDCLHLTEHSMPLSCQQDIDELNYMQGPQLPGMLSKLSGLFSSLQGNLMPSGLGANGYPGQSMPPEQAAGSGLPTQDPNLAMMASQGQAEGADAGQNPSWRSFSDMMQVTKTACLWCKLCNRLRGDFQVLIVSPQ